MRDRYRRFYRENPRLFDRFASREDRQGRLFAALNEICLLDDLVVVECGAGTGRLTRMLTLQARFVYAFELEYAMLRVARENLLATGMRNWSLAVADNMALPAAPARADLVIEGWSFGHTAAWYGDDWRRAADHLVDQARRLLKPGGSAIFIETLGAGQRQPLPPSDFLAGLYRHWQEEHGFQRRWIRTDFQFASLAEAEELLHGFFGGDYDEDWLHPGKLIVPECSGIWWKRFA